MNLDRFFRNAEMGSNLFVQQASGDEFENLLLPAREQAEFPTCQENYRNSVEMDVNSIRYGEKLLLVKSEPEAYSWSKLVNAAFSAIF